MSLERALGTPGILGYTLRTAALEHKFIGEYLVTFTRVTFMYIC